MSKLYYSSDSFYCMCRCPGNSSGGVVELGSRIIQPTKVCLHSSLPKYKSHALSLDPKLPQPPYTMFMMWMCRPVHGLIFLYKWRPGEQPQGSVVQDSRIQEIFFAKQVKTYAKSAIIIIVSAIFFYCIDHKNWLINNYLIDHWIFHRSSTMPVRLRLSSVYLWMCPTQTWTSAPCSQNSKNSAAPWTQL